MKLGKFMKDSLGDLHGRIFGVGLITTSVTFEPHTSKNGAPYFRVIANPVGEAYDIGAAFEHSKDGFKYFTVTLDSPAFAETVHAVMFPDRQMPGQYNLYWERPEKDYRSKPQLEADTYPARQMPVLTAEL